MSSSKVILRCHCRPSSIREPHDMSASRPDEKYLHDMTWEEKAQVNPLYAVMSVSEFAQSGEPTEEEFERFYEEGLVKVNRWIAPWLQETDTPPNATIMEFGCGMGRLLNALAQTRPPECLFGVDISETMIRHARGRLDPGVTPKVITEQGTFPYSDAFFDRVYSYAVFQHISQKSVVQRSIAEIARVLKPGGKVKLQFWMLARPAFENGPTSDSFAFESSSVLYGWKSKLGLPLYRVRKLKSNNWGGIRMGYRQLVKEFEANGIHIHGIVRDYPHEYLVWLYGTKA